MKNTLLIIFVLFIAAQIIQTPRDNPISDPQKEIQAPKEVHAVLKKACYDCHSNQVQYPWYANVAPVSWMISRHVNTARQWVNFSVWEDYTQAEKEKKLKEIFRAAYAAMPLSSYMAMHEKANITMEERKLIRDWTGVRK